MAEWRPFVAAFHKAAQLWALNTITAALGACPCSWLQSRYEIHPTRLPKKGRPRRIAAVFAVLLSLAAHPCLAQLTPEGMNEVERLLLSFSDGRQQAVPSRMFLEGALQALHLPDEVRQIAKDTKSKMDRCELVAMLVPPGASVDLSLKKLYDEDCLTRADQLPDITRGALDRTTLIMRRYTEISGMRLGPEYYCAAVRVSASVAVTARHCISDYIDAIGRPNNLDAMHANVELLHPVDLDAVYTIIDYKDNTYYSTTNSSGSTHSPIDPKHDYIFLKLTPETEEPPLQISKYADISPLILYAPHRFPFEIGVAAGQMDTEVALVQSLRWDEQGSCFGVPSLDGCIFHGCQTEQMNSGGGLFLRDADDRLVLVGIHLSTARNAVPPFAAEGCSLPHKTLAQGNAGILFGGSLWTDLVAALDRWNERLPDDH